MLEEMNVLNNNNIWGLLQQPAHPGIGIDPSFRALLAGIDLGWHVEEPVQVRTTEWADLWIYTFILTRPGEQRKYRLSIPAVGQVEIYVKQNGFQVIESNDYDFME